MRASRKDLKPKGNLIIINLFTKVGNLGGILGSNSIIISDFAHLP